MPCALVKLEVIEGDLKGETFHFDERSLVCVGRSPDCDIQIPPSIANSEVSRHHCMFDIDPPHVRVVDLDSLRGTAVNGLKLGGNRGERRSRGAIDSALTEMELQDGDDVRVGLTVFHVITDEVLDEEPAYFPLGILWPV